MWFPHRRLCWGHLLTRCGSRGDRPFSSPCVPQTHPRAPKLILPTASSSSQTHLHPPKRILILLNPFSSPQTHPLLLKPIFILLNPSSSPQTHPHPPNPSLSSLSSPCILPNPSSSSLWLPLTSSSCNARSRTEYKQDTSYCSVIKRRQKKKDQERQGVKRPKLFLR